MPTTEAKSRIPDSYTRDKPKKKKKKSSSKSSERGGVDLGAIFGGPQGFLNKGLESNWGQRKVPKEKQSDLDWIQQHGPVGDTKADGTKATRPEIVGANQRDLDRRIAPNSGFDQAGFDAKKAALQKPAANVQGDEAMRVAFGQQGQPVGFATRQGDLTGGNITPADEGINRTGNFTNAERGSIQSSIAQAPETILAKQAGRQQMNSQIAALPDVNQPSPFDLGAVFPQGTSPPSVPTPATNADPGMPVPNTMTPTSGSSIPNLGPGPGLAELLKKVMGMYPAGALSF